MSNQRRETRAQRRKRVIRNRMIAAAVLLALIVLIIVLIVSCGKKNKKKAESLPPQTVSAESGADGRASSGEDSPEAEAETETKAADPVVNIPNEKPVHLYTMSYDDYIARRVTSIQKPWTVYDELETFAAICSTEESFPFQSETEVQNMTWNSVNTETPYKIGYELSFDVDGEHKVITILQPGDIENNPDLYNGDYPEGSDYSDIPGYMGVWVYDDLHQDGGFYTHITQEEVTDETLLTSIKFRPTPQSDQISNFVLRGFSYSSDKEFDAEGHYTGNYAATVTIGREE